MKVRFVYLFLIPLSVGLLFSAAGETLSAQERSLSELEQQAFQEVAAKLAPAMVQIETVGGRELIGGQLTATAASTGVVVSADGYIITSSYHFLSKPNSILVRFGDGRRLPAKLVSRDSVLMVTLLKVEADNLLVAEPAKQESLRVGQWAVGLGKTYDVAIPNMTVGIVSALNRVWGKASIQTDAKISPVNYGGPIVNLSGKVMGILVPLSPQATGVAAGTDWYDSGIGFAVSLEKIRANLPKMIKGIDLKPGLLGVSLKQEGTPGLPASIEQVLFASPAEKAGIKAGDLVLQVDDKKINSKTDFQFAIKPRYAGETVKVLVKRSEQTSEYQIKLTDELLPYEPGFLGILPQRDNLLEEHDLSGLGIRFVYPDSPAAKAGLNTEDRILKFNDQSIKVSVDLQKQLRLHIPKTQIQLTVTKGGQERKLEIHLASQPDQLPQTIPPVMLPVVEKQELIEKLPERGHFTEELKELKHRYWAYVPEDYHPGFSYGLLLWLHGTEQENEAATFKQWKQVCDQRGIILLAPQPAEKSGWTMEESSFLEELVELFQQKYHIDSRRIVVHGDEKSGQFAMVFGIQNRKLISGIAVENTLLPGRLPENTPAESVRFYLKSVAGSKVTSRLKNQVKLLQQKKYSFVWKMIESNSTQEDNADSNEHLSLWIDSLDRL